MTPWTAALQASLSFTISLSLLKLMPIGSVMPSKLLILCRPLLLWYQSFPASGSFPMSHFLLSCGQSIGASASAYILPMSYSGLISLGLTDLISLLSKGLSRVFQHHSSKASILQRSAFFMIQLPCPYITTGRKKKKHIALTIWTFITK